MQEGVWTRVSHSKRVLPKWDVFPFGGRNRNPPLLNKVIVSMYVSEFPEVSSAKDLFDLFGCIGSVVEVAISPRRNKLGKRFGFARFVDVADGRMLAVRLDNTIIGGKKIHVNLPRFRKGWSGGAFRGGGSKSDLRVSQDVRAEAEVKGGKGVVDGIFREGCSYAEAVSKAGEKVVKPEASIKTFLYHPCELRRKRLAKAYVGRVCIPGWAYNIQNQFDMEGVFAVKVLPLGGNLCLLEEVEEGFIEDLLREGESWWRNWFSEIKRWEEGMVDDRRDMWIRLYDIPALAWQAEFFVSLAESWGRFICIDENTAKGGAFDVARMLINVPLSFKLPETMVLDLGGSCINIFFREDAMGQYFVKFGTPVSATSGCDSFESEGGWAEADSVDSLFSQDSIEQFSSNGVLESKNVNAINKACLPGDDAVKDSMLSASVPGSKLGNDSNSRTVGQAFLMIRWH
ncbi:uncharacterized protein LOC131613324 [Vicia villosa]|uniref:uncharacterized protein LOC131613324 n=1 Tax=Vicia villosa TaxID=3911 RepID=UPI00273B9065|nr:uncharacterized protein LOC131613324 [Vicia villosa]